MKLLQMIMTSWALKVHFVRMKSGCIHGTWVASSLCLFRVSSDCIKILTYVTRGYSDCFDNAFWVETQKHNMGITSGSCYSMSSCK